MTSQRFDEFWQRYPRRFGKDAACRDWVSVVTVDVEDSVFSCLGNYLRSAEVQHGAVMAAGSGLRDIGWIMKCHKDGWDCSWPPAVIPKGMSEMGPSRVCICGRPTMFLNGQDGGWCGMCEEFHRVNV